MSRRPACLAVAALCASFGACAPSSLRSRLAPWPAWAACRPRRPCAISGLCPSCRGRRFGSIRVLGGVRVYLAALWCRFLRAGARRSLNFPKKHLTRFCRFSPPLAILTPRGVSRIFALLLSRIFPLATPSPTPRLPFSTLSLHIRYEFGACLILHYLCGEVGGICPAPELKTAFLVENFGAHVQLKIPIYYGKR